MYLTGPVEGTPIRHIVTVKAPNSIELSKHDEYKNDSEIFKMTDFNTYLGHTQAPTSSVREFAFQTSHPFTCGNWTVAHNGVLTNHLQLQKNIKDTSTFNEVDTSIIPALLNQEFDDTDLDEVTILSEILSKLKGTFGLWLFSKVSGNVYLARSGSTLFGNFLTNDFSSLQMKGFQPLQEGILYLLTREGITSVGFFSTNSPFLAL